MTIGKIRFNIEKMDKKYMNQTIEDFTKVLASSSPAPGGGGAVALVAAVGIALGNMVGNLTVGKKKYADVEDEIKELMVRSEDLRERFLNAIDDDEKAFLPLAKAYSIPKDDPDREKEMERCLRIAAAAPLNVLELCCEAILIHKDYARLGSKLAVSDAATGVVLCWGAMYGAAVNVKVNTGLMKDREYAEKLNSHVEELMNTYYKIAENVYEDVYRRL